MSKPWIRRKGAKWQAARMHPAVQYANYGELERAAGITDREAFWKGKSEEEARAELYRLIDWRAHNVAERD